jgi:phage terminase large subunit-like protein
MVTRPNQSHPNTNEALGVARPFNKQRQFLELDCLEAFYGGAAAGGKSQALLMAALQYIHVPGYSALILRRDTRRLGLAGGLIPRSHEWLIGKNAKWNEAKNQWTFPTHGAPATLTFGYLNSSRDKFRYLSSEYQFIGFDELTEFEEEDYLFLFSRLRRRRGINVTLRMRSASNPGGIGHDWVKQRFIADNLDLSQSGVHWKNDAAFVPARLGDNPAISQNEYRRSLNHLPALWRERMMNGDWRIAEVGIVKAESFRYYTEDNLILRLWSKEGRLTTELDRRQCRRIMTIDAAGTDSRSPSADHRSFSATQVWEIPRLATLPYLVLIAAYHEQLAFDRLKERITALVREHKPTTILIENEKFGKSLYASLQSQMPIHLAPTNNDKRIVRAGPLLDKLERGEVFFPKTKSPGVDRLMLELLSWNGHDNKNTDQIDAAAYAALACPEQAKPLVVHPVLLK